MIPVQEVPALGDPAVSGEKNESPWPRVLFVTGSHGYPSGLSGYDRLISGFPSSEVCGYDRRQTGWLRLANPLARSIAGSRWVLTATIWNELRASRRLNRGRFDLVHLLWGERDLGIIDRVASRQNVPLVVSFHAPYHSNPHPLRRLSAVRNLAGVVLVSSSQLPFFSNLLPASVARRVILHGIDTRAFCPGSASEAVGPFKICFVGSFRRDFEGLQRVIERFHNDSDVEFHLLIPVGLRSKFSRFSSVRFASNLSDVQLAEFYRRASCLLITLEDATANNALLEAMASGLPIVAEDVGGTREYVGADAGRLLPKGDVDGLVEALRGLRADAMARQRMSASGRQRACALSWECVAQQMRTFYGEVLTRTAHARN